MKYFTVAIIAICLFTTRANAQADYVIKDTTYTTAPNAIALKSYYANVESAEGTCSGEGKQLRIRGLKDGGTAEFTVPNAETVRFVVKGKSTGADRIVQIYRDGELIRTLDQLDANNCAEFTETLHRNAPVTYKITAGNSSDTKPVALKSIVVEKYQETTGVDKLELNSFKVFPNPVQSTLNVELADGEQANSYRIYNVAGQLMLSSSFSGSSSFEITVGNLPKGFYTLSISNGQQSKSIKLVKK